MSSSPRLGLGFGVAAIAPADGRRKIEQIEIDHDQVYGHQFPRGFSTFPFPNSLQHAGTGTRDLVEGSFSISNRFRFPRCLQRGNGKWEVCRRVILDPLGHFLGSAPAEHFLRPSFIPAAHSIRRRAQGRSRPAHLGRRRLGLEGPEHDGMLDRHG